jgi:hypothetical protein
MSELLERLIDRIRSIGDGPVHLDQSEIDALNDADCACLIRQFGTHTLVRLPGREREFFAWVRMHDPEVWAELWYGDEDQLVSLAFLPFLRTGNNGFPICDLATHENYFFTQRHLRPEAVDTLDKIIERIENGQDISIDDTLLFEVLRGSIDLWHFCYKHKIPLDAAKAAVGRLSAEGLLVHLTSAEDLVPYLTDIFQPTNQ